MLKSNNPTAKQSQKWLLESLLDLLNKKNYQHITVAEICKNSNLDRRTFYRNFDSKDDVMELQIHLLRDEYVEMLAAEPNLSIYAIAKIYFEFWKKHIHFLRIMHRDGLTIFILSKYDELLPTIHKLFHEETDKNLEYVLAFNTGGFWNILVKWVSDGAERPPSEMAGIVAEIIMNK